MKCEMKQSVERALMHGALHTKWSPLALVFVKYFKHCTENEFGLNQYWGHGLENERKIKLKGEFCLERRYATNIIKKEENGGLFLLHSKCMISIETCMSRKEIYLTFNSEVASLKIKLH